jgi:hypothetical protein
MYKIFTVILGSLLLIGCANVSELVPEVISEDITEVEANIIPTISDKVAVVFAYVESPLPDTFMSHFTDSDWSNAEYFHDDFSLCILENDCWSNNLFFAEEWWNREANNYNADFELEIDVYDNQIEIKDKEYKFEYTEGREAQMCETYLGKETCSDNTKTINPDGSFELLPSFERRLFEEMPELREYENVNVVVYYPIAPKEGFFVKVASDELGQHSNYSNINLSKLYLSEFLLDRHYQRAHDSQDLLVDWISLIFENDFDVTNKLGGLAEGRVCIVDPETGIEVPNFDFFCRTATFEEVQGYSTRPWLEKLFISDMTARELDWIQ